VEPSLAFYAICALKWDTYLKYKKKDFYKRHALMAVDASDTLRLHEMVMS
jgi:hypothetical protein